MTSGGASMFKDLIAWPSRDDLFPSRQKTTKEFRAVQPVIAKVPASLTMFDLLH